MRPRFNRVFEDGKWEWCCFNFGTKDGVLRYAYGTHETMACAWAQWVTHATGAGIYRQHPISGKTL